MSYQCKHKWLLTDRDDNDLETHECIYCGILEVSAN